MQHEGVAGLPVGEEVVDLHADDVRRFVAHHPYVEAADLRVAQDLGESDGVLSGCPQFLQTGVLVAVVGDDQRMPGFLAHGQVTAVAWRRTNRSKASVT